MRQEPCTAWGHLFPANARMREAVNAVLADWGLPPCAELRADVLDIAFEGAGFPLADVAEALRPWLTGASSGKIDVCDREQWTLTRALFHGADIRVTTADLNNVLAYSGH